MDGGLGKILFQANPEDVGVDRILNRVDDYSLFCHYLGRELDYGQSIHSPLRFKDDHPSFWLFEANHNGRRRLKHKKITTCYYDPVIPNSGDIFDFVSYLNGTDLMMTLRIIDNDLRLGIWNEEDAFTTTESGLYVRPIKLYTPKKVKKRISITSTPYDDEFLRYWYKLGINKQILQDYKAQQARVIHFEKTYPDNKVINKTFFPKQMCVAYGVGDRYQVYLPKKKKDEGLRFMNDMTENMIFGYLQLPPTGNLLIIDKSMKDVMYCRSIGLNAVAPKGEGIMIPKHLMIKLLRRFKHVFIMLDNDDAGRRNTERYIQRYPSLIPLFLPDDKDKTDLCSRVGVTRSKSLIYRLLKETYKQL